MTGIEKSRIFAAASVTRQIAKKVRSYGVFKYRFPATGNNKSSLEGEKIIMRRSETEVGFGIARLEAQAEDRAMKGETEVEKVLTKTR